MDFELTGSEVVEEQPDLEAIVLACKKEKKLADDLIEKAEKEIVLMQEQIDRMKIMSEVYQREINRNNNND
jgi:riboflavin biosynthesis pyrimidine reductase